MKLAKTDDKDEKKSKGATRGGFEISVPTCKICKLDPAIRLKIDTALATGMTQVAVLQHWNELLEEECGPDYISPVNISTHSRRHINLRQAALRQIMEKRAAEIGLAIDETVFSILTKEAVLESMVVSGLQNIAEMVTLVEPKELLSALDMLRKFEGESSEVALDEIRRQFEAFLDAVKTVVPEEMYALVAAKFEDNMRKTSPKAIAQHINAGEAEVVTG